MVGFNHTSFQQVYKFSFIRIAWKEPNEKCAVKTHSASGYFMPEGDIVYACEYQANSSMIICDMPIELAFG